MKVFSTVWYISAGADRRGSVASNAPSEVSRSEVATRKGKMDSSHVREQPKSYYKVVYENKEVNKLLQMLGTAISSTKAVSLQFVAVVLLDIYLHWATTFYVGQDLSF